MQVGYSDETRWDSFTLSTREATPLVSFLDFHMTFGFTVPDRTSVVGSFMLITALENAVDTVIYGMYVECLSDGVRGQRGAAYTGPSLDYDVR